MRLGEAPGNVETSAEQSGLDRDSVMPLDGELMAAVDAGLALALDIG